jgi:hypothetical protein
VNHEREIKRVENEKREYGGFVDERFAQAEFFIEVDAEQFTGSLNLDFIAPERRATIAAPSRI